MRARRPAALALLLASLCARAQTIEELQFVNQPITDILLSLAQLSRRSIVPDDTVSGTATYYFARAEFDEALTAFLEANHLYAAKRGDAYFVSRIRAELDPESGLVRLDAEEVEIQAILRALSRAIGRTILVDGAPRTQITVTWTA